VRGGGDKERREQAGSTQLHDGFCISATCVVLGAVLMLAPGAAVATGDDRDAILSAVRAYATALYARDFAEAYRWIAAADRELKSLADYERDNEPFKGSSLVLARRLAHEIVVRDPVVDRHGHRATVRAKVSLPNGNAEELSSLLFAKGGTAEAPADELANRMAKLESLIAGGNLPWVHGEETWTLVQDRDGWRVFLDWGSGVRIRFATRVSAGLDVNAAFDRAEVLTPRGGAIHLRLTVRNRTADPVRLKVIHRVEPAAYKRKLDLVQCGFLVPTEVPKDGVEESPVVYYVEGDLPKSVKQLRVTLEFQRAE
jgi:hypothetical protein